MKKFALFISGRGSNMAALLEAFKNGSLLAEPVLVISNRAQAPGLDVARAYGVRTEYVSWKNPDAETRAVELVKQAGAEFIVLAGFMRVVGPALIEAFPDSIINIHPSLLPSFPGLHAQQQAVDYGVRVSGCTTHFVNAGVDTGPIILQKVVEVRGDDTGDSLAARILEHEHTLLVRTVNLMAENRLRVENDRHVRITGDV